MLSYTSNRLLGLIKSEAIGVCCKTERKPVFRELLFANKLKLFAAFHPCLGSVGPSAASTGPANANERFNIMRSTALVCLTFLISVILATQSLAT